MQAFAQGTVNYEYDANNRLTKVIYSSGAVVTYTYDELGNRLSKKVVGAAPKPIIHFYDQKVKAICVENWDTNGDGELSYEEAAAVTDLGGAFNGNEEILSFNELQYFAGLTALGDNVFQNCLSLSSVYIPDGVTSIGNHCFWQCRMLGSLRIPDGLKTIGANAFEYCYYLPSLDLPDGLESIGNEAFQECNFSSLHIPSSVSSIGSYLFGGCDKLVSITVDPANDTYDSRGDCNAIIETATNTLVAGCKNTVMPDDLKAIGDGAFYGHIFDLFSLTIPESVTSIGDRAFAGNYMVHDFVFPANLEYVGWEAFEGTGWINIQPKGMVYINNNVACQYKGSMPVDSEVEFKEFTKSISPKLFTYGTGSKVISISLPKTVKVIGYSAFEQCVDMTSVTVYAKTPPALDSHYRTFPYYMNNMTLYVPYGTKAIYENTPEWNRFKTIVEMEPPSYIEGDANGDGKVNINDAVAIVNYTLGIQSAVSNAAAADVNGDGVVDIADAVGVMNIILNK